MKDLMYTHFRKYQARIKEKKIRRKCAGFIQPFIPEPWIHSN